MNERKEGSEDVRRRCTQTCVLLSGGMDSTAAMHWALGGAGAVKAVGFDYGQPARERELRAAESTCARRGVAFTRVCLADGLRTSAGLLRGVEGHHAGRTGTHPAFVPGRNAVLLAIAAAHAATWWPSGPLTLVVGANADDASGFPDCNAGFLDGLSSVLGLGIARDLAIEAPFVDLRKSQIVASLSTPQAREDVERSWSCYRGDGPCGTCSPCVLRREAFLANASGVA